MQNKLSNKSILNRACIKGTLIFAVKVYLHFVYMHKYNVDTFNFKLLQTLYKNKIIRII